MSVTDLNFHLFSSCWTPTAPQERIYSSKLQALNLPLPRGTSIVSLKAVIEFQSKLKLQPSGADDFNDAVVVIPWAQNKFKQFIFGGISLVGALWSDEAVNGFKIGFSRKSENLNLQDVHSFVAPQHPNE
jgi:hypothetical protein